MPCYATMILPFGLCFVGNSNFFLVSFLLIAFAAPLWAKCGQGQVVAKNKNDNPPKKTIKGGKTEHYPIKTKATERLEIDLTCDSIGNRGSVSTTIKSEDDKILYYDTGAFAFDV